MQSKLNGNAKISLADFSQKKELAELWAEAFGDSEKFIASFLDAYMIPEYNVPVVLLDGKIISMLYLIEFNLYSNDEIAGGCAYLFAAATKKEHRGKGYMSELVRYSVALCGDRGFEAVFLFPQNRDNKLFDLYSRFGFENIYGAKKITGKSIGARIARPQNLSDYRLTEKDITDVEVFDGLYDSYVEFTAKQALAPVKDRLFYFRCASSYLNPGAAENSETEAYFAVLENNVEKFCYVFYKKYKNNYYLDDIILAECSDSKEANEKKYAEITEILPDFLLDSNSGGGVNFDIYVPVLSADNAEDCVPLAMLLPLSDKTRDIRDSLEHPVYINMFMNV